MKNTFHVGDRVEYPKWPNNPGTIVYFEEVFNKCLVGFDRSQPGMHNGGGRYLSRSNGWWCNPELLTLIEKPVVIPSSNLNSLL